MLSLPKKFAFHRRQTHESIGLTYLGGAERRLQSGPRCSKHDACTVRQDVFAMLTKALMQVRRTAADATQIRRQTASSRRDPGAPNSFAGSKLDENARP
jgi:hypothetical protein